MTGRLLSLLSLAAARRHHASGHWQSETFYDLAARNAAASPKSTALADSSGSVTWADALDWADRIALRLADAGLRPGDRVAIWCPSRLESALVVLACARSGFVALPSLHRDHTLDEVARLMERSRAAALFLETGYGAALQGRDAAAELAALPHMRHVEPMAPLVADNGIPDDRKGPPGAPATAPATDADAISFLAFTSGTTGPPKGVMHSSNTYLSNARAIVADYGLDRQTVTYTFSPMSHNMGTVSLAIALISGGTLVLHNPIDSPRTVQRIVETGASYLIGVPTHGLDLIAALGPDDTLGRARVFQLAGTAVPLTLVQGLSKLGITVQNTYGMTENCSFLYTRAEDADIDISEGWSIPAAGMEIAILDSDTGTTPMPPGETGEIGIRGCSQMLGYFDDQIATETALNPDGWFLSGDLGTARPDGRVRIVGRKKDLIIRGGHNIQPAPIEDTALQHPAIKRAAAFPVPDERLGEKMCLAIIAGQNAPTAAELLDHLAAKGVSPYDMPEYFLVCDSFPQTASGKILKRAIAAMVADGQVHPQPCRYRAKG